MCTHNNALSCGNKENAVFWLVWQRVVCTVYPSKHLGRFINVLLSAVPETPSIFACVLWTAALLPYLWYSRVTYVPCWTRSCCALCISFLSAQYSRRKSSSSCQMIYAFLIKLILFKLILFVIKSRFFSFLKQILSKFKSSNIMLTRMMMIIIIMMMLAVLRRFIYYLSNQISYVLM